MTHAEIGRHVGLSAPAVGARIARLEERGVIEGFSARVVPAAIGYPITAFIILRAPRSPFASCIDALSSIDRVIETHRVTGDQFMILRVMVADMRELEATIDRIAEYGIPSTMMVLSSTEPKPLVPLLTRMIDQQKIEK